MRRSLLILIAAASLAGRPAPAQAPARLQIAEDLLAVMKVDELIRQTMGSELDRQIQQNPLMAPYRGVMEAFFKKYVTWDALRPDMARLYADLFTDVELREMIAFYRTSTGQKLVTRQSDIMRRASEIGQNAVVVHQAELEEMIRVRSEELQREQRRPPQR